MPLREYELMLILPVGLEDEASQAAIQRVQTYVTSHGGAVDTFEPWGRRRLAYPIKHQREGMYHLAKFSLAPEHAIDLDRTLQRSEQVLRHLMVRVD